MSSKRASYFAAAGTYVLGQAVRLDRVVVNTGAASATVTLQMEGSTFAIIDAANPDVGRVYDLLLPNTGLTVVVAQAPDVTVLYD